jgi:hypothetical protein
MHSSLRNRRREDVVLISRCWPLGLAPVELGLVGATGGFAAPEDDDVACAVVRDHVESVHH